MKEVKQPKFNRNHFYADPSPWRAGHNDASQFSGMSDISPLLCAYVHLLIKGYFVMSSAKLVVTGSPILIPTDQKSCDNLLDQFIAGT